MKIIDTFFRSFRAKVTLALVLSMLFAGALSNFLIYEYSLRSQFEQLRNQLMTIAQTASFAIDADTLLKVPMTKSGVESAAYKEIAQKLTEIDKAIPSITYIYTMTKTGRDGIFKFVVDPEPEAEEGEEDTAYPGDEYDATGLVEIAMAFERPAADKKLFTDAWGTWLSGYAPIKDKNGSTIAILGVDMSAKEVADIQKEVRKRAAVVLGLGLILSVALGMLVSSRLADPVRELVQGTSYISRGHLEHRVRVRGDDEIAELARSFNKMTTDLKNHIEELKRTTAEKERLLKELEIAKGIQQSFLPDHAPVLEKCEIVATTVPARVVGGDFYDFIPVGKDMWGLVVADVSGKGIPAALFMALSRTLIRASTTGKPAVEESIKLANRLICEDAKTNMFVTLFYALLDSKNMTLKYLNAGHNPPILFHEEGGNVVLLEAQGIPLGMFPEIDVKTTDISLKKGDVIALYTDGITEAINDDREQFQIERLANVIRENRGLSAKEITIKTQEALRKFVGNQPQFDDITLMVLRVT